MIKGFKVRIYPTKEQELTFNKFIGASRFIYNWTIDRQSENYKKGGKFISSYDMQKHFRKATYNILLSFYPQNYLHIHAYKNEYMD